MTILDELRKELQDQRGNRPVTQEALDLWMNNPLTKTFFMDVHKLYLDSLQALVEMPETDSPRLRGELYAYTEILEYQPHELIDYDDKDLPTREDI